MKFVVCNDRTATKTVRKTSFLVQFIEWNWGEAPWKQYTISWVWIHSLHDFSITKLPPKPFNVYLCSYWSTDYNL